jgi:hypothetical protein
MINHFVDVLSLKKNDFFHFLLIQIIDETR